MKMGAQEAARHGTKEKAHLFGEGPHSRALSWLAGTTRDGSGDDAMPGTRLRLPIGRLAAAATWICWGRATVAGPLGDAWRRALRSRPKIAIWVSWLGSDWRLWGGSFGAGATPPLVGTAADLWPFSEGLEPRSLPETRLLAQSWGNYQEGRPGQTATGSVGLARTGAHLTSCHSSCSACLSCPLQRKP